MYNIDDDVYEYVYSVVMDELYDLLDSPKLSPQAVARKVNGYDPNWNNQNVRSTYSPNEYLRLISINTLCKDITELVTNRLCDNMDIDE